MDYGTSDSVVDSQHNQQPVDFNGPDDVQWFRSLADVEVSGFGFPSYVARETQNSGGMA